jgi:hypothetical protein
VVVIAYGKRKIKKGKEKDADVNRISRKVSIFASRFSAASVCYKTEKLNSLLSLRFSE